MAILYTNCCLSMPPTDEFGPVDRQQ